MAFSYDELGKFGDRRAAEDWARRNNIDPRDLHFRDTAGGVDVGVRKGVQGNDDRYDDRHGDRRSGFWTHAEITIFEPVECTAGNRDGGAPRDAHHASKRWGVAEWRAPPP